MLASIYFGTRLVSWRAMSLLLVRNIAHWFGEIRFLLKNHVLIEARFFYVDTVLSVGENRCL